MQYERPLLRGKLIRRYKRFLADIELTHPLERRGERVTAHCANTGSMTNCKDEGAEVWLFDSQNPKRKLPLSWEWVAVQGQGQGKEKGQHKACINTARANQLVKEALLAQQIPALPCANASQLKPEPKVDEGRLDFFIAPQATASQEASRQERGTYIEVKSVTLLAGHDEREASLESSVSAGDGIGFFPDAVSTRGAKHLDVLMRLKGEGYRAVLLFCVPHQGIQSVRPAAHIDPIYTDKLRQAKACGVEVLAYKVEFLSQGMVLKQSIPVQI